MFNFINIIRYNSQYNALKAEYEARQHEVVSIVNYVLSTIFIETYNDLLVIKNANEFSDYIQNPSNQTLAEVEQMFFRISGSKPNYNQIRYLNKEGFEVVRLNNYNNIVQIVPRDELQDKSRRYYVKSALSSPEDTLYISYLDLNIENNEIILPHEPVIRFAISINKDGENKGIIIINYDGYKILSILNKYVEIKDELINVGVFDSNSYWQFEKENSLGNNILIKSNVNDIIPQEVLEDSLSEKENMYIVDSTEYQLQYIEELSGIKIHFESEKNIGVFSTFDLDEMVSKSDYSILKYPLIPYAVNLFIIAVSLLIILLSYHNKTDMLMMSASKYISEYTHDGIIITDNQKKVIYCNNVLKDTFGYCLEMLQGKYASEVLKGSTKINLYSKSDEAFYWAGNIWDITITGAYILKLLKIKLIQEKKNDLAYYIGIYSEPKVNQKVIDKAIWGEQSAESVENDLISGLPPIFNKDFYDTKKYIVIVIKIVDFIDIKYQINEGEESSFVLNITSKLKSILNEESVVLSPASDLFLIKTPFYGADQEIPHIMEVIDNVFIEIRFSGYPSYKAAYLSGIAIFPIHGKDSVELLTNAFIVLEFLIKTHKSKYMVYNEKIYDIVRKDKTIRNELKYAFEKNEFSVVYQVQKTTEGKNIGVEALVRWTNSKLGNVSPDFFIPIMEESVYIKKLGLYVLKTVIKDFETIKDIIPDDFKISINLSSSEFTDKQIVASLIDIISSSKLKLENFGFEITETTLVTNLAHTNDIIKYLHEKKIVVSIDDFGTGFSSLRYLKTLYADKLKIDQTFIKDYPEKDDGTMIKAIVSMATQLKIGVIVEGIETDAQLNLIKSLNCKEYQGYYGSKPIGFRKFIELFMKTK